MAPLPLALEAHAERLRTEFVRTLLALSPRNVLDVGCGEGAVLARLAARGIEAVGVEENEGACARARTRGLDVRSHSGAVLGLEDDSIDWVSLRHVLHHMKDPAAAAREAWRVARFGVLMAEPHLDSTLSGHVRMQELEDVLRALDRTSGRFHGPNLTADELLALLDGTPLSVEQWTHVPLAPLDVPEFDFLVERSTAKVAPTSAQQEVLHRLRSECAERRVNLPGSRIQCMRKRLQSPETPSLSTVAVQPLDVARARDKAWSPETVAQLNGQELKVARFDGAFDPHAHPGEDEAFFVLEGQVRIEFPEDQKTIELGPGELAVVPRGVVHRPVAEEPAHVLMFEPKGTRNTGDRVTAKTL